GMTTDVTGFIACDCAADRVRLSRGRVAVCRSCWRVQRLELLDQRPNVLTHLYLNEKDADRAVGVGEEVGTQSAGPADAAPVRSLCLHGHAKTPSRADPKPGEEAVRGLAHRRDLVAAQLLEVLR